jgi:hypothetical protein
MWYIIFLGAISCAVVFYLRQEYWKSQCDKNMKPSPLKVAEAEGKGVHLKALVDALKK